MTVLLNLTQDTPDKDSDILCQIVDLENVLFDDGWDGSAILSVLAQFGAGVLVYLQGAQVLGYCIYTIVFETAEILRIATCPDYQRQGIGDVLLDKISQFAKEKHAEKLLLEVRADNEPAIRLYLKHGFCHISTRPKYYDHKTDALILQRKLDEV